MKKKILVFSLLMIIVLVMLQSVSSFSIPKKEDRESIWGEATIEVKVQEKSIVNSTVIPLSNVNVTVKFSYWPGPILGRFPLWGDSFGDTNRTDSNGNCILTVKTLNFAALNFYILSTDDQLRKSFGFANVRTGDTKTVEIKYYTL
jgi:hypothetical protein